MSKRDILSAGGSVRQSVNRRNNIADFAPDTKAQGLYIDADVQQQLMHLIERLFDQKVNANRSQEITIPLTDIELDILDIVCKGRHTNRAALMREFIHNQAGKYHHKYRNMNNE